MKILLKSLERNGTVEFEGFNVTNKSVIVMLAHTNLFSFEGKNYAILGSTQDTVVFQECDQVPIVFTREDFDS